MLTRSGETPLQGTCVSPNASRLLQYLSENNEKLGELMLEPGLRQAYASSDEGYQETEDVIGSPPEDCSLKIRSTRAPEKKLEDATNMVILSNLPSDVPYSKEEFADDALIECAIYDAAEVKLSKLSDMIYIYNLSDSNQRKLALFMEKHYPEVLTTRTMGVPPYRHIDDTTEMLLNILKANQCEEMSYKEIYEKAPKAYLILTKDFPFDTNRLVEVTQKGFYGVRLRSKSEKHILDERHMLFLISIRRLAPFVHQMISTEARNLDRNFLRDLGKLIVGNIDNVAEPAITACAVSGEAHRKPLEHLVSCVPGVEVVWSDNKKIIRKLELPEKNAVEQTSRSPSTSNASPDAVRLEQDIVKTLSDILKKPSNLYMSLSELGSALKKQTVRLDKSLRQFITERSKHFQILGEGDYEVVTLSHRAQIKRVCNDLQKVLRPRKPKCISSADIAVAFASHWKTTNEVDRRFNVEDFGVCYLDDLLVTIPQHWGVHCSEYVSTEGVVVRRTHGEGEEQIPDFVPSDTTDRVHAWIPRHHQTESQRKSLALLRQQTLNMFRGDPSAEKLIDLIARHGRNHNPECTRLYRLAVLRAHRPSSQQASTLNGRDNPMLPCHFKLEEKTFVPLYHRFCGEQVTLSHYGVKDLYELFDSMQETFIASGHGQERIISLTADARREILERRIVDILRMADRDLSERDLILRYREQPTMLPYFDVNEIRRAIDKSKLILKSYEGYGSPLYQAREFFDCTAAIASKPDIAIVLKIFMLSYAALDIETIKRRFLAETNRPLNLSIVESLEKQGAIRLVNEYEQKFDLHDTCRVVRNLVYQMNEHPNRTYTVNPHYYLGTSPLLSNEVSVFSLLSFSGDFTYIEPHTMLRIMKDFTICFERVGQGHFQLRRELVVWVPTPEETEGVQSRRANRGSHQTFRPSNRGRQSSRGTQFQRTSSLSSSTYQKPLQRSGSFGSNAH